MTQDRAEQYVKDISGWLKTAIGNDSIGDFDVAREDWLEVANVAQELAANAIKCAAMCANARKQA